MPSEPGKCYARCLIQDQYEEVVTESDFEYTCGDLELKLDKNNRFEILTPLKVWVKKLIKDCAPQHSKACTIWTLETVQQNNHFELDEGTISKLQHAKTAERKLLKAGGFTEWREVVCDSDITKELYSKIQEALFNSGYFEELPNPIGLISKATKVALVKYQKDNGLPVGQLDIETLKSLGIRY